VQAELGEAYRLYFLEDKEGRPVAVVLPVAAVDLQLPGGQEVGPLICCLTDINVGNRQYCFLIGCVRP
jgi:hypothetical protein